MIPKKIENQSQDRETNIHQIIVIFATIKKCNYGFICYFDLVLNLNVEF